MIKSLSSYHLIFELLYDGKGNIHPDLEPIEKDIILEILEERAQKKFSSDINKVIDWFLNTKGIASDAENESIKTILKIMKIEKRSLEKLNKQGFAIE